MKFESIESGLIENFTETFKHELKPVKCKKDRKKEIQDRILSLDPAIEKNGQMTLF
jgi:hypothetical protein